MKVKIFYLNFKNCKMCFQDRNVCIYFLYKNSYILYKIFYFFFLKKGNVSKHALSNNRTVASK